MYIFTRVDRQKSRCNLATHVSNETFQSAQSDMATLAELFSTRRARVQEVLVDVVRQAGLGRRGQEHQQRIYNMFALKTSIQVHRPFQR